MSDSYHFTCTVYYEDTDAGGVVYHANYLKYAERARSQWLLDAGLSQRVLRSEQGVGILVAAVTCEYKRPGYLEDRLTVHTTVHHTGRSSFTLHQDIHRAEPTPASALLAHLRVRLVCVNADGKPIAIPAALQRLLQRAHVMRDDKA